MTSTFSGKVISSIFPGTTIMRPAIEFQTDLINKNKYCRQTISLKQVESSQHIILETEMKCNGDELVACKPAKR